MTLCRISSVAPNHCVYKALGVCRLRLAQCLQNEEGMAVLGSEVEGGQDAHAALAFLATAIKDHGAVSASIELHRSGLLLSSACRVLLQFEQPRQIECLHCQEHQSHTGSLTSLVVLSLGGVVTMSSSFATFPARNGLVDPQNQLRA